MPNLILEERDQRFVLHEMLTIEDICTGPFADFSRDMFDMILTEAGKLAHEEILPALEAGDRQGCRLENGQVHVPESFHRLYKLYCEGGWISMTNSPQYGGQGLPEIMRYASWDWFLHNFAFFMYPGLSGGAAELIEHYGSEEVRQKYLPRMITGEWGGSMALTEPGAGTDVGALTTRALRQPDGSFLIKGTKIFISAGDHDLAENIVQPVLARIEGDPAGTGGISLFLVPKYIVNDDGSLGRRNDYEIAGIEDKMGIHGSATCLINFGDNDACYGELLGEERQGMKIMFFMMNGARMSVGIQGLSSASFCYLHALQYARERLQGSALADFKNPQAPRVPIISHPDVRRMLLTMKAHVDSMRAMMYYAAFCQDRARVAADQDQYDRWNGIFEVLTPICKAYNSDIGFRVCESAMQIYGGYGYCREYPIEQVMRDEKIGSIYEGTNGIQSLDLVGRKLGMKKGACFLALLSEMNATIAHCSTLEGITDLAEDVQAAVNTLAEMAMYFAQCGRQGKFMVPLLSAYPFLMLMGTVVSSWLLLWEAGLARQRLDVLAAATGRDPAAVQEWAPGLGDDPAFYAGKLASARFFIKNILPGIQGTVAAIKNEDVTAVEIDDACFAV